MNDFFSNLFGTIAGYSGLERLSASIDSIPIDGKGRTIKIKGGGAKWMGMRSSLVQKHAYEFCYPVASVIDRLAEYDLTGKVEILRATGKGRDNFATNEWAQRMNTLLEQPNGLQSWEQFRGQQTIYKKTHGFCPVLPILPVGFENQPWMALALINIPPWLFKTVSTRNPITTTIRIEDFVKEYQCTILGRTTTLRPDQVMILEDGFAQDENTDFILPLSRLVGLDMAVSNICAAMEADNVLLRKKGPLGFISHDATTKDQVSYTPMSKAYRNELQKALRGYGLSWDQFQYVISRQAAKWVPMSYNPKELGTGETIVRCEKAICHRFAFPYILYEETDTTYANGDNAAATVYQTNVIPNNTKDLNKYNKFFKAKENVCKITGNFEDVGALQEDKQAAAEARKIEDEALAIEYANDLITLNQWRERLGWDTVEGGDVLKSQLAETDQPLAIALGVGGTQAMMAILTDTVMDPETKRNALMVLFKLDQAIVNKMVVDKPKEEPQPPKPGEVDNPGEPKLKINLG